MNFCLQYKKSATIILGSKNYAKKSKSYQPCGRVCCESKTKEGSTDLRLTWVGARDACVTKKQLLLNLISCNHKSKSYQPRGRVCGERKTEEGEEGGGAEHQDGRLGRKLSNMGNILGLRS